MKRRLRGRLLIKIGVRVGKERRSRKDSEERGENEREGEKDRRGKEREGEKDRRGKRNT